MYELLDTFVFRTPYFPYSALSDFAKWVYEPIFREMLQIATPDLSECIDNGEDRVKLSAYRYFQRASIRPTPFGLFAGCSVGKTDKQTKIQLADHDDYKRITRLDMNYICSLTQQIEKDRNIRKQLNYYVNNSMYCVGNNHRYVEYNYLKTHRVHQIAQLENSEYLLKVLAQARGGALFTRLSEALVNDEITIEEANEFIHELINEQVLISELDPAVTKMQPLTSLITKLKSLKNIDGDIVNTLYEIENKIVMIDHLPIGTTSNIYPEIINNIEKTKVTTEIKYLFQSDLFKPSQHATLSRHLMRDIQQGLIFLNKITPIFERNDNILKFKKKFIKRYEDREMPLLLVLDSEIGIGYIDNSFGEISPLVDDLVIPRKKASFKDTQPSIQTILMKKSQQSLQKIIELTDEDIKDKEAVWDDLPPTFPVLCQILQDDDKGRSVYIKSACGQSAASILGRFCHLDEQILNHTLTITEKEAQMNPNVIIAEIVHLPESRVGNILLRPVLRPYEIPYLAKTGVSAEFELRPDDLYISVTNNRIVLRSKRLNKEIVPRISSAHNFDEQNSLPVYHFLCDLQHQNGRKGLGFHWNETALQLNYLPRVIYKNCILSPARWMCHEKDIKMFIGIKNDDDLLQKIKEWQDDRNIPDEVLFADNDDELYVDMRNELSIRAWLSIVKKRSIFYLEEFLLNPATAIVQDSEGVFNNEFIFAFYKDQKNNE